MRKYLFILLTLFSALSAETKAQGTGGELVYRYLGRGTAPNTARYRVELYLICDQSSKKFPESNPGSVIFNFFNVKVPPDQLIISDYVRSDTAAFLTYTPTDKCLNYKEPRVYRTDRYRLTIDLPITSTDYTITTNLLKRSTTLIMNIDYSRNSSTAIYLATIAGTEKIGPLMANSTPPFRYPSEMNFCKATGIGVDYSITDPDGDMLLYKFGILNTYPANTPNPLPPPYPPINFLEGYESDERPLGEGVVLDENSGLLHGVAPSNFGNYQLAVQVEEYRNGVLINSHNREQIFYINSCLKAKAELKKLYNECDSYTYQFKNEFTSTLPVSYQWDFGVLNSNKDTSTLPTPRFTYSDTGTYLLKLVVNNDECKDSATGLVKVYPGFKAGFSTKFACSSLPVEFVDTSRSVYGTVDRWSWNFGDLTTSIDTSTSRSPTYTFPGPSIYKITEIAFNTLGCSDTATESIILGPKLFIEATADTSICKLDTIGLHVSNGIGKVTWTPSYEIDNVNSDHPKVSPDVTTVYKVDVVAGPGCEAQDSVVIKVAPPDFVQAYSDTSICENDLVTLHASSDYKSSFSWTPSTDIISGANSADVIVKPKRTTTYVLNGQFGSCTATSSATVTAFPYPIIQTFGDTTICFGKTITIGVNGNADNYLWRPSTYLNDSTATRLTITPDKSIQYILQASNNAGCIKPVTSKVNIRVYYAIKAFAGNDTAITINQPLQLQASGGANYSWMPDRWLNNNQISNPIATPDSTILYRVKVSDNDGCIGYDSLLVRVFYTGYDLLVPTAFSPNNDGLNDYFKITDIGITDVYAFTIFNRWGEMIYSSKNLSRGWDGRYKNQPAPTGVYVWYIKAKKLDGTILEKRGTVTLVR